MVALEFQLVSRAGGRADSEALVNRQENVHVGGDAVKAAACDSASTPAGCSQSWGERNFGAAARAPRLTGDEILTAIQHGRVATV